MLDHGSVRALTHLVPRKTFFPDQVLFRPRPAIINTTCTSLKFHSDSQAWWGSSEKEDSKVGKGPPLLLGDDEMHTHTHKTRLVRTVKSGSEREREKKLSKQPHFFAQRKTPQQWVQSTCTWELLLFCCRECCWPTNTGFAWTKKSTRPEPSGQTA